MIQHLVLFQFKEAALGRQKRENLEAARTEALKLPDQIPEILSFEVFFGAPGSAADNFDFVIVSTFTDMDALNRYQVHPAHAAFGAFMRPLRTDQGRVCIDYAVE